MGIKEEDIKKIMNIVLDNISGEGVVKEEIIKKELGDFLSKFNDSIIEEANANYDNQRENYKEDLD